MNETAYAFRKKKDLQTFCSHKNSFASNLSQLSLNKHWLIEM